MLPLQLFMPCELLTNSMGCFNSGLFDRLLVIASGLERQVCGTEQLRALDFVLSTVSTWRTAKTMLK